MRGARWLAAREARRKCTRPAEEGSGCESLLWLRSEDQELAANGGPTGHCCCATCGRKGPALRESCYPLLIACHVSVAAPVVFVAYRMPVECGPSRHIWSASGSLSPGPRKCSPRPRACSTFKYSRRPRSSNSRLEGFQSHHSTVGRVWWCTTPFLAVAPSRGQRCTAPTTEATLCAGGEARAC